MVFYHRVIGHDVCLYGEYKGHGLGCITPSLVRPKTAVCLANPASEINCHTREYII